MNYMKQIVFKIVTPEKVVLEETIDQLTIPTQEGEITVLPDHLPLVAVLKPGEMTVVKNGQKTFLAVSGGFVEVQPNIITILADTAETAEEIDEARAEEARARAEKLLKEKQTDTQDFTYLAAKMEKELARLRVVRKHRSAKGISLRQE